MRNGNSGAWQGDCNSGRPCYPDNGMFGQEQAQRYLGTALRRGGDWADLFVEETVKNHAQLSDQAIKNVSQQQLSGAGLRVVHDHKEYYAYTNDLSDQGMLKIAREVAESVAKSATEKPVRLDDPSRFQSVVPKHHPEKIPWQRKVGLIKEADSICREVSPSIVQVNVDYLDEVQRILVANSDGLFKEDERTRGRFTVTAVAGQGDEKQVGYEAPGAHRGFEFFEDLDIRHVATTAAETAVKMLTADYAPQGPMTVIIDSGFGGVIFHEACGHLLEASAIAKKASVMAGQLGEVIAAPCVSAVDDGTLEFEWGSSAIDDEGAPTQRNLLIENGVLKSYLVDRLNGERIGLEATGSSRRQSYRFSPTSRMNNTYILPGTDKLEAMISDTEYGFYAKKMGGGSVNPATGEFNFAVTEGYLIRGGKIVAPVRGAVLIGRGEEILKKIDRVGDELKLAQGLCGASSGWVPVDVGQPAIRVQDLLVGGQSRRA